LYVKNANQKYERQIYVFNKEKSSAENVEARNLDQNEQSKK